MLFWWKTDLLIIANSWRAGFKIMSFLGYVLLDYEIKYIKITLRCSFVQHIMLQITFGPSGQYQRQPSLKLCKFLGDYKNPDPSLHRLLKLHESFPQAVFSFSVVFIKINSLASAFSLLDLDCRISYQHYIHIKIMDVV